MLRYRKILVCLVVAVVFFFAAGAAAKGGGVMSLNKVPKRVESNTRFLMQDLSEQGFEVSRGYFKLYTVGDCAYTFPIMHSCYANNAAAPYVTFAVPPWPEEFPGYNNNLWGPSQQGYEDIFRLDPKEAIVILGRLPPPAAYFAVQTYIFSRQGLILPSNTYDEMKASLPALLPFFFAYMPGETPDDPGFPRYQSFSSLSNPINDVVIERQSRTAFNQIRYFIITPDKFLNDAVRSALADIGIKQKNIFTESIPSDMRTGLDQAADTFTTLIRYAQPVDGGKPGTASYTWRKDLPMAVLRIRDTSHAPEAYPDFTVKDLEQRTTQSELKYRQDLGDLLAAVARRWGQPCANSDCSDRAQTFQDLQTPPPSMVGPACTSVEENCLADNWDAAYQLYGPSPLDNGQIYAVAGTLGTETGNATYVAFGINYAEEFLGVANLSDKDLKGSAKTYRKEVNNTGKFFLYYFARDCSGLEDLTDENCFEVTDAMIPPGSHLGLSIRDYIMPGTERGPDSSQILPAMVLPLVRPQTLR